LLAHVVDERIAANLAATVAEPGLAAKADGTDAEIVDDDVGATDGLGTTVEALLELGLLAADGGESSPVARARSAATLTLPCVMITSRNSSVLLR